MSLISDVDFLIHSLRLSYLRDVEDPYGSRIISLDPSYTSNPYIVAASLADEDSWPEITMPASPQLSEDEEERPLGFPGARLKYTQTIMGGRSGGLGMRVHGKRASTSKRMSGIIRQDEVGNFVTGTAPVQDGLNGSPAATTVGNPPSGDWVKVANAPDKLISSSQSKVEAQEPTLNEEPAPVGKVIPFIPRFKGAAEMEKRRQARMAARRRPGAAAIAPPIAIDSSSSSDEDIGRAIDDSSDDSDFGEPTGENGGIDEDFDPDFAGARTTGISSDSASEIMPSISISSAPLSPSHRPRLSPVSENIAWNDEDSKGKRSVGPQMESLFEMVAPITVAKQQTGDKSSRKLNGSNSTKGSSGVRPPPTVPALAHSDLMFTRKKVTPIKPVKSALSAMLASSGASMNPFTELYAAISGRGASASTNVQIYFPHARQPSGKPMDLNVRADATIEEVIGFALWTYWDKGWLPRLDDGLGGDDDPRRETRLSAVGWVMKIAEDDGEVDDDFPPPDRMGPLVKVNVDVFAVLEATPSQIADNRNMESKIQRRPSRTTLAKKSEKLNASGLHLPLLTAPGTTYSGLGSALGGSVPLSTSLGPSSSHGPQIFLRVRIAETADDIHLSTTIAVSAGMYMQEALELLCKKRKINPKDYALLLADMSILIPLDRTVASLQGKRELVLVKRSMIEHLPSEVLRTGRTTDPNASIFKRISDAPEVKFPSALDYTGSYKKYTIYRKMPMLVARQERTLAIDGVHIHIMPSSRARAVFDSGKTFSYHVKSIADCQQSTKSSSTFKLVFNRGGGKKRYDYEAESPKLAGEIVQAIKAVKTALERSGTLNSHKLRRSRHVS